MKTLLTTLLVFLTPLAVMAAQPRVNGVEVMQANGGTATNVTVTGTNAFRGNANELHAIGFVNEQLAGSTVLNFSYGDGSSITSNRWRIGASSINFNIYDVKTARFPISIASADGSAGGDGNVNINGVSITTNGATYVPGGLTVSNSLTWTSVLGTITFLRRVLPTNGTIVDRYHFGDDMGQTYSWQFTASTNRFIIQRQNSDTDFPLMLTRVGMKVNAAGQTLTNTGNEIIAGGDLQISTGTGLGAVSNNAGATTITTSNSTASRITQRTAGVGIGTATPAVNSALDVPGTNSFGHSRSTNAVVLSGLSASNAWVGGTLFQDLASHTNHSTANNYTNLSATTIGGHTLTNNGDRLLADWSGVMLSGTNRFVLGYGSITNVLAVDGITNGHPLVSWGASMRITRTGNTGQRIYAEWWTASGFGIPYSYTNREIDIAETNGIDNLIRLQGSCIRAGGITNSTGLVEFKPGVR